MKLHEINFPIFPIRKFKRLYEENNILKIDTHYRSWIIDNRNLKGSFIERRFNMNQESKYPLNLAIFNIVQLLKYNSKTNKYIDYNGKLIKYKPTQFTILEYFEVIYTLNKNGIVALFVKDLPYPFYITLIEWLKHKEIDKKLYLGLLEYMNGKILYDISNEKKEKTWKKI